MIRIRITSPDSNVSGSAYINLIDPQIVDGYWWYKETKIKIKQAFLGQAITFRIKTEDMRGELLKLQLYDTERKKFTGDSSWIRVSDHDEAELELELNENWWFEIIRFGGSLKLYFEVQSKNYPQLHKRLPADEKNYLILMPRLLYVAPQSQSVDLPFIYSRDGELLSIRESVVAPIAGAVDEPLSNAGGFVCDYYITQFEGKLVKTFALKTVKGYFDYGGGIKDMAGMIQSGGKVSDMTLPLTGSLSPLAIAADLVVSDFCKQLDEKQELAERLVFDQKKRKGYNEIQRYISKVDPYEQKYALIDVTPDIAVDILKGKFNSKKELDESLKALDRNIEFSMVVLLRYVTQSSSIKITIVEAIYIRNL